MPLRADDRIAIEPVHDGKKWLDITGIELHVGVDESDQLAAGTADAAAQRVALAHVDVVLDYLDVWRNDALGFEHGVIGVAVRYDDYLIGDSQPVQLAQQPPQVLGDVLPLAISRHDD